MNQTRRRGAVAPDALVPPGESRSTEAFCAISPTGGRVLSTSSRAPLSNSRRRSDRHFARPVPRTRCRSRRRRKPSPALGWAGGSLWTRRAADGAYGSNCSPARTSSPLAPSTDTDTSWWTHHTGKALQRPESRAAADPRPHGIVRWPRRGRSPRGATLAAAILVTQKPSLQTHRPGGGRLSPHSRSWPPGARAWQRLGTQGSSHWHLSLGPQ